MIADLLPPGICGVESWGDAPDVKLLPEEDFALGRAAESRRREFATARACARQALSLLGQPAQFALLRGPQREPLWPEGITGSITHCQRYRAASVATTKLYWSLGIDAETNAPLPDGILEKVSLPEERNWINSAGLAGICWDRLTFSAKESVYKAWFPLARRWLGFFDARIEFNHNARSFEAHLLNEHLDLGGCELQTLQGRFLVGEGLLLTFVGIPK